MSDDIRIEGLDELTKRLKELGIEYKRYYSDVGEKAMLTVEAAAKEKCPVDLGHLRGSISTKTEEVDGGVNVIVGTNLKYAAYVEFGTGIHAENGQGRKTPWRWPVESQKWQNIFFGSILRQGAYGPIRMSPLWYGSHPHPFLRPAWDENRNQVYERVRTEIAAALRQVTQ